VAVAIDYILLSSAIEYGFTIVRDYLKELYGPNTPFILVNLPLIETAFSPTTRLSRYLRVTNATDCTYTRYSCQFIGNEPYQDVINVNLDLTNRILIALKSIPTDEQEPLVKKAMKRIEIAERLVELSSSHLRPYKFLRKYNRGDLTNDTIYSDWINLFEVYAEAMSWFTNTANETETKALLGIYKIVETNRYLDLINEDFFLNPLPMSELNLLINNLKNAINEKEKM